jgi:hypothetical protein
MTLLSRPGLALVLSAVTFAGTVDALATPLRLAPCRAEGIEVHRQRLTEAVAALDAALLSLAGECAGPAETAAVYCARNSQAAVTSAPDRLVTTRDLLREIDGNIRFCELAVDNLKSTCRPQIDDAGCLNLLLRANAAQGCLADYLRGVRGNR